MIILSDTIWCQSEDKLSFQNLFYTDKTDSLLHSWLSLTFCWRSWSDVTCCQRSSRYFRWRLLKAIPAQISMSIVVTVVTTDQTIMLLNL